MIHYVDPNKVIIASTVYPSDVKHQKMLLEKQGQIEPLIAIQIGTDWLISDQIDYPWACAQVVAARELGWDTVILIDHREAFEEGVEIGAKFMTKILRESGFSEEAIAEALVLARMEMDLGEK